MASRKRQTTRPTWPGIGKATLADNPAKVTGQTVGPIVFGQSEHRSVS
jgi:hypothetical protein